MSACGAGLELPGFGLGDFARLSDPLEREEEQLRGEVCGHDQIGFGAERLRETGERIAEQAAERLAGKGRSAGMEGFEDARDIEGVKTCAVRAQGGSAAAMAAAVDEIGEMEVFEASGQVCEREVVVEAGSEQKNRSASRPGGFKDGLVGGLVVRSPGMAVAGEARIDRDLFSEKAQCPEVSGAGGEKVFECLSQHGQPTHLATTASSFSGSMGLGM